MAKHHPDLIMCRKQPGISVGRLCEKCDGKCPICDSYVRPNTLVRICDECNYGSFQGRCIICGGPGISDAYYCKECTIQEKDVSGAHVTLRCARAAPRTPRGRLALAGRGVQGILWGAPPHELQMLACAVQRKCRQRLYLSLTLKSLTGVP